jgi:hypothetical protein
MNHQPFEFWLLEDQPLEPEQKRDLQSHLRACTHCTALAETGVALRSARERGLAAPAAGFTLRFRDRLAAHKAAERRRRLWGMAVLTVAGVGLLAGFSLPLVAPLLESPARWLTVLLSYVFFLASSLKTLGEVGLMFARVAPGFVPPFFWMVMASAVAGIVLLWVVSIWRLTYVPRGVNS